MHASFHLMRSKPSTSSSKFSLHREDYTRSVSYRVLRCSRLRGRRFENAACASTIQLSLSLQCNFPRISLTSTFVSCFVETFSIKKPVKYLFRVAFIRNSLKEVLWPFIFSVYSVDFHQFKGLDLIKRLKWKKDK